jgi:hypothetical protein
LDFVAVHQLLFHRWLSSFLFSSFSSFTRHLHLLSLSRLPTLQEQLQFLTVPFSSVPSLTAFFVFSHRWLSFHFLHP